MEQDNYRIEWKVDVEELSEEGYESLKRELEERFDEEIKLNEVTETRPCGISGLVPALVIISQLVGGVAGLITVIEYLLDQDDTAKILVIVPKDAGEDYIKTISETDDKVEVLQRK